MHNNSKLGLGLAALGRPSYINLGHHQDFAQSHSETAMEQRAHEVLNAAWDAGVRYFDTARSYGLAERFLAHWLDNNPSKVADLTISSKWGYTYTANWDLTATVHEVKEHSLDKLTEQWQQSQELLSQHLDIYLVHSATFESGILNNQAVLEKLQSIKEQHHVSVGISVSGTEQAQIIEQALDIELGGERLFDVIQTTYNLLERSAEQYQSGIDAIALAAVQQQPFVDVVLSGAATAEQLIDNLKATKVPNKINLFDHFHDLTEISDDYWAIRSQLAWN